MENTRLEILKIVSSTKNLLIAVAILEEVYLSGNIVFIYDSIDIKNQEEYDKFKKEFNVKESSNSLILKAQQHPDYLIMIL